MPWKKLIQCLLSSVVIYGLMIASLNMMPAHYLAHTLSAQAWQSSPVLLTEFILIFCCNLLVFCGQFPALGLRGWGLLPPKSDLFLIYNLVGCVYILVLANFASIDGSLASFYPMIAQYGMVAKSNAYTILMFFLVMPLLVELVFRGLVIALTRQTLGTLSIWVSSVLWSFPILFDNLVIAVGHFAFGLLLGSACYFTRSLWTPVVMSITAQFILAHFIGG